MALQDIVFLTAVGSAYVTFMLTLGWASWYCRDQRRFAPRPSARPERAGPDA
jgi:hypothetical protein